MCMVKVRALSIFYSYTDDIDVKLTTLKQLISGLDRCCILVQSVMLVLHDVIPLAKPFNGVTSESAIVVDFIRNVIELNDPATAEGDIVNAIPNGTHYAASVLQPDEMFELIRHTGQNSIDARITRNTTECVILLTCGRRRVVNSDKYGEKVVRFAINTDGHCLFDSLLHDIPT